jgi:hypothetical protein
MQTIGRYQVVEEVARGGVGIVYRALDPTLGREVALKVLPPYYAQDTAFVLRFRREAQVAARLSHPNIVAIYDVGEAEGLIYIAMQFVEGSLERLLQSRDSPLSVDEAFRITSQIANALEYAHSQGVIHRDVKPSNILLTAKGDALLSDFGVAKALESVTGLTQTGTIVGTPEYMSPEQAMGGSVDPRSDIYSLGVVLYEMLSLRPPLSGGSPTAVLHRIIYESPESIRVHNPAVPLSFDKAVLRALAKEPDKRYKSASLFVAALERGIEGISPDEFWHEWRQAIVDRLLDTGQVRANQLIGVPEEFRAYAIDRFVDENPQIALFYAEDKNLVALARSEQILAVLDIWDGIGAPGSQPRRGGALRRLLGMSEGGSSQVVSGAMQISAGLSDLLGVSIDGHAVKEGEFVSGLLLDGTALLEGLNIPAQVPCVFTMHTELTDADVTKLRSLLANQVGPSQKVALLLVFGDSSQVDKVRSLIHRQMKQVYAYDVMTVGRDDLVPIIVARDAQRELRRLILRHVDLLTVSPFVITGPTPDIVFFGREPEMREITEQSSNTSFAIIGGRRMGKSSLLIRLHRVRLPAAGFRTLYHDCSTTPTYRDFLAAGIRDWRPDSSLHDSATFGDLLKSPGDDRSLVLLLDEADKLVPADRADRWRLFNALRALINSGRAQVVLSGERTLRDALRDPTSPLFNFANLMLLGPLDFRAAEELVTLPMKQLEIELADESAIVRRIYDFTSGHPNVIQRLCRRLVEWLNEQGTRRITLEDVDAVIEDPQFQETDFLQTYWEAATPLEKIITLVLSQEARTYRLKEVRQLLDREAGIQPGSAATKDALDRLVDLRLILKRSQDGYAFAVEAFPRVLASTATVEDLLEVLVEQYGQTEAQG